ncbi:MAG: hypothetical protein HY290_00435 [Planctomycetia bacterium]|nr:hypothetical protein [Planctomycetia bacterium]
MFDRMANGWELAKASLRVLRVDKELLLFPLVSTICCLVVLGSFVVPLWNSPLVAAVVNDHQAPNNPVAYLILFAFYFVNYFVIVFFNSALVSCAIIRFKGGEPTLGDGFRAATNRLPQILAWSLVSATVGVLLRAIESHAEKVGQIISAVLGGVWSIATYFVVPVLVVERVDPFTAVKRSLAVLRHTWGEALTANFGIGFVTFIAMLLVGLVPLVAGGFAMAVNVPLGMVLIALGVAGLFAVALVSSTLDSILLAALYLYAAEGEVPAQFDKSLFEGAFASK